MQLPVTVRATVIDGMDYRQPADSQERDDLTPSMRNALKVAAARERGQLCPVMGVKGRIGGGAERTILAALHDRGLINYFGPGIPIINDAGRAAVAA